MPAFSPELHQIEWMGAPLPVVGGAFPAFNRLGLADAATLARCEHLSEGSRAWRNRGFDPLAAVAAVAYTGPDRVMEIENVTSSLDQPQPAERRRVATGSTFDDRHQRISGLR